MGYPPVPAQPDHLLQYAAFLARSLKAPSVRSYLNIVGILHKEFELPNPLNNNWSLKSLLTGINRQKGLTAQQKLPITTQILTNLYSQLDLATSLDASFWAICLVSFFGMFRKSHLLPTNKGRFDHTKQLTKSDIRVHHWGVLLIIRWSKTIQFRERVVQIPLPRIPDSPLCPTTAVMTALSFTSAQSQPDSQAFNWVDSHSNLHVFTYDSFLAKLRLYLAALAVDPKLYASHSFRRGGASFAYQAGVPIELIKALGDWRSDTVLIYLTMPLNIRLHSANQLCKAVLSLSPQQSFH